MRVVRDWDFLSIHANYVDMGVLADIPLQSINYETYKNQILLGLSITNVGLGKPTFKNYEDLLNEPSFETNRRINTGLTYRFFQKSDLKKYEDFSVMISPSFTSVPHIRNRAYVGFQLTWIEILSMYTGTKNYAKSPVKSGNMHKESLGDRWGCEINLPLNRITKLRNDIALKLAYAKGDEFFRNKKYYHVSISGNWN